MAAHRNVIIFGATGGVGSVAVLKAYQERAKVNLAMRDPSKPVQALDNICAEKIRADLNKPGTVQAAVCQSNAKVSFVNTIPSIRDGMRRTFVALKEGGIQFVVLLSSFTVQSDLHAISPTDIICSG